MEFFVCFFQIFKFSGLLTISKLYNQKFLLCTCLVKSLVKLTCYNFFRCAICVLTTLEPIWPWLDQTSEYICANSGKTWKFSTTIQVIFLIHLVQLSIVFEIGNWNIFPRSGLCFKISAAAACIQKVLKSFDLAFRNEYQVKIWHLIFRCLFTSSV